MDSDPPSPQRVEAWVAISELFLDTELDDADIASVAYRLRATGFAPDELDRIYEDEVAPVCARNLEAVPGGEWVAFDRAWLVEAIRHRKRGGLGFLRRFTAGRATRLTREDWKRVCERMSATTSSV